MKRLIIVAIMFLCVNSVLYAQSMKVGKSIKSQGVENGVVGIVESGTGLVQVRVYPGTSLSPVLTYDRKSFVTFQINKSRYFTNNDIGFQPDVNTKYLKDGILSQTADTIRCTWYDKDGVDLIQEIYPVLFEKSEQIVFRWKAVNHDVNHNDTDTAVAVQYLLDLSIDGNDKAKVLTRSGYRPNWFTFNLNGPDSTPPFYIAFYRDLPNSPTFNPGLSGQGYLDNTYYNLGLTKPTRATIGDWPILITQLWGPASGSGNYGDVAILFEFPGGATPKGKEATIAATSYGTGEFEECNGQLASWEFYPHRIKWQDPNLIPNPFPIDMYIFNPSGKAAPNTSITLSVGNDLTILSPSPVTGGGRTQTQLVAGGGNIPADGVGLTTWIVKADKVNCTGSYMDSLKFIASSPSLGYPVFAKGDGTTTDTCEHTIVIECAPIDFLKPIAEKVIYNDTIFTTTLNVRDNRTKDAGLKSISWSAVPGTDTSKFKISYTPIVPCDKTPNHVITIKQKDTTISGCIKFTIIDCVNLRTDTTICFSAHPIQWYKDTVAPLTYKHLMLSKMTGNFFIADSSIRDTGIKSVTIVKSDFDSVDILIDYPLVPCDKNDHVVYVTVHDSIHAGCVHLAIMDCAGNITKDSVCFKGDTSSVGVENTPTPSFAFDLIPNPAMEKFTIHLNVEHYSSAVVKIVDMAGREVRKMKYASLPVGVSELAFDVATLGEGTYYVIVELGGEQYAKTLKIVR